MGSEMLGIAWSAMGHIFGPPGHLEPHVAHQIWRLLSQLSIKTQSSITNTYSCLSLHIVYSFKSSL